MQPIGPRDMTIVEDALVAPLTAAVQYGPPVRLTNSSLAQRRDISWTVRRLGLTSDIATSFRNTVVNDNLLGALLDAEAIELATSADRFSRMTAQISTYELTSEFRRSDLICHELKWPTGERATIEVHARHFVATWTCGSPVDRIGQLFETDLANLPISEAEAAFAIAEDSYQVAPSALAGVLADGVDDVDWFRVNLLNESFVWMRRDPRGEYGLFGLVSDRYDSRLILALLSKTATTLVRASTRSMLRVLGDVYRSPGIEIRRPSMMDHFSKLAGEQVEWT